LRDVILYPAKSVCSSEAFLSAPPLAFCPPSNIGSSIHIQSVLNSQHLLEFFQLFPLSNKNLNFPQEYRLQILTKEGNLKRNLHIHTTKYIGIREIDCKKTEAHFVKASPCLKGAQA
jgi:hypothetical protein